MPEMKITKPFIGMFTTYMFIFSTMYTLAYFWFQAAGAGPGVSALAASDKSPDMLTGAFWLLNWILDMVSWISPFALVRGMVLWLVSPLDPNLYTFIDLLFMRPVSWITSMIVIDFAISKIPTESGE